MPANKVQVLKLRLYTAKVEKAEAEARLVEAEVKKRDQERLQIEDYRKSYKTSTKIAPAQNEISKKPEVSEKPNDKKKEA